MKVSSLPSSFFVVNLLWLLLSHQQKDLVIAQSSCSDSFTQIESFSDLYVREIEVGFLLCFQDDESTNPFNAFETTRIVWTIEPAPGNETIIYTSPPNLVKPFVSEEFNITKSNQLKHTISFRPDQIPTSSTTDGVGVLIQVPSSQLETISSAYQGSDAITLYINDGFNALENLIIDGGTFGNEYLIEPKEGAQVYAKLLQNQQPLKIDLGGRGMDVQIDTNIIESFRITAQYSNIIIKGNFGGPDQTIASTIIGSNYPVSCPPDKLIGTCNSGGLNVVLDGSFQTEGTVQPREIKVSANKISLIVVDPTNTFNCTTTIVKDETVIPEDLQCLLSTEVTADVDATTPFPCTITPTAYTDTLKCPGPDGQTDTSCGCMVEDPNRPNTGGNIEPCICTADVNNNNNDNNTSAASSSTFYFWLNICFTAVITLLYGF